MKKRITSVSILMAMALSLVPHGVMAESSLTLKSFNATKKVITLDFEDVADAAAAAEGEIKIRKKNSEGDVLLDVSDFTVTVSGSANQANTVMLKPAEGVDTNAAYNVEASGAETGWFQVEEMFADDFETGITKDNADYSAELPAPYSWAYVNSSKTIPYMKSDYWNTIYREGFNTVGDGVGGGSNVLNVKNYNKFMLRNNSQYVYLNDEGFPMVERVKDYTVEAELGIGSGVGSLVALSIRDAGDTLNGTMPYGYNLELKTLAANGTNVSMSLRADKTNLTSLSSFDTIDKFVDIRMSAIGTNIQVYADDSKLFDVTNSSVKRAGGTAMYGSTVWTDGKHITLDNVSISKVIKYELLPEITVKNVKVTDNLVEIEFLEDIAGIKDFITLKKGENEYKFDAAVDGNVVTVEPDASLEDGIYILTLKEGLAATEIAFLAQDYQVGFEKSGETLTPIAVVKPDITNIISEVKDKKFTMSFDYTGGENDSAITIFASDSEDGVYSEIYSGRLTTSPFVIDADEEFVNKYLKLEIQPKNTIGFTNNIIIEDKIPGMFAPVISEVIIADNFEGGSLEITGYDDTDKNGDTVTVDIQWYSADSIDGKYEPIEGEKSTLLTITPELYNKFIKAYVTPKADVYPEAGDTYISQYYCRIFAPEALDVKITGLSEIGGELKGSYKFSDKNDPSGSGASESGTTVRWFISSKADGTELSETGNTTDTFRLDEAKKNDYIGKYLYFEVTPRKAGIKEEDITPELSPAFACPARPTATNVSISGTLKSGYTVSGVYTYSQVNGVEEGASEYRWYVDNTEVSTERFYTIKKADEGKKLYFWVKPVAKKEPTTAVDFEKSQAYEISKKTTTGGGSYGSSGGGSSIGSSTIKEQIEDTANKIEENQEYITDFTDIADSPYKKEIIELSDMGIIKGMSETIFAPKKNLKRSEFVTLMVRVLGINVPEYKGIFTDVFAGDWYADNIQAAHDNNLISGYAGRFRPNDSIKREEIIKILIEAYEKKAGAITPEEAEMKNVSEWAKGYADKAAAIDLIGEKEFVLNEYALREEAAVLIYRFMEKAGEAK